MFILNKHYSYPLVILLLTLLNLIQDIRGREVPDITFVIKNVSNAIEPICIADKNVLDSAIAWIYPIEDVKEKLPVIVSKYVPEVVNDYNCDFLKTKHCSKLWEDEDWQFSKFDSHKFKLTLDTRWEDFPTILTSNAVKEFKNRIDIPHTFEMGISIRAARTAEIFLCTGWDPHSYPCYYINIGGFDNKQVFLRKYKNIPEIIGQNETKLDQYLSDEGILSTQEWKNFYITLDENGTLTLVDVFKNVTILNYKDNRPIQPIFLFIRSKDDKALWKIHNNHYIFTNKTILTQLGPTFSIPGDSLCVSLYVSMCRYCRMSFYVMINGKKQIIKTVFNENEHDDLLWKEIKLLQHDLLEDKIKLFVETKYVNNTTASDGFWGIDDVRVCSEDEIKVTHLITNVDWKGSDFSEFSCQALTFPTWRPIQYNFISNKEEIEYTSTSTTIKLSWNSNFNNEHNFQQYYTIRYEGKDICDGDRGTLIKSKLRIKSQGSLIARSSVAIIKDLIPYTTYNVTFWNVIDGNKVWRDINTLPTDLPKEQEIPSNVIVQATDTACEISWNPPSCNLTYGSIIYQIKLSTKNGTVVSKVTDIKTNYTFKDLQPFLGYEVEIRTARKLENLEDPKLSLVQVYNFTTHVGVAPVVENLEVYAASKNLVQLRFDLPDNMLGKPNSVQIRWCNSLILPKCNSNIKELRECKLWDSKYCVVVDNLISGYTYLFLVSVKTEGSYAYGKEANTTGLALDRVPGTPSNVTYRLRNCAKSYDCCHINISWVHPYNQSGIITMFDIVLTESSYTFVLDSFKSIHEVLKVTEASYQRVYNYNIKYISCVVPYKIEVRAVNDLYKGEFASTVITINNNVDYVDPMPKYINSTNETVVFKLPQPEKGLDGSSIIIIVQDYDKTKTKISDEISNLEMFDDVNELCNQFGETWVAKAVKLNEAAPPLIVIGDGTSSYVPQLNKTVINKRLTPDTEYCFTFTIIKRINESENVIVYHDKNLFTETNYFASHFEDKNVIGSTSVGTYLVPVLLVTLLIVCGAWLSYRYFKRKRHGSSAEHIYETMPFEDYLTDAVSNDTYDHLSHD